MESEAKIAGPNKKTPNKKRNIYPAAQKSHQLCIKGRVIRNRFQIKKGSMKWKRT